MCELGSIIETIGVRKIDDKTIQIKSAMIGDDLLDVRETAQLIEMLQDLQTDLIVHLDIQIKNSI